MKEKPLTVCKDCACTIEDGCCDAYEWGGIGPPTRPTKKEWKLLQKTENDWAKMMNAKKGFSMIKIDPTDMQLIIPQREAGKLFQELENAFCIIQPINGNRLFSVEEIKKKFPELYKLYRNL